MQPLLSTELGLFFCLCRSPPFIVDAFYASCLADAEKLVKGLPELHQILFLIQLNCVLWLEEDSELGEEREEKGEKLCLLQLCIFMKSLTR